MSKSNENPLPKEPAEKVGSQISSMPKRGVSAAGPSSFMGSKNSLKTSSLQTAAKLPSSASLTAKVTMKSSKQSMLREISEFPEIGEQFIEEDEDD